MITQFLISRALVALSFCLLCAHALTASADDARQLQLVELATAAHFSTTCGGMYHVFRRRDEHRAYYYGRDEQGREACGFATGRSSLKVAQRVAEKSCRKVISETGSTASCAPFMLDDTVSADLEAMGIDLNPDALLRVAIESDNQHLLQSLIALGASHKVRSSTGMTAMLLALENRNIELIDELLARGADFNERTNNGMRAVHSAARGSNPALLERVIAAGGGDVNAQDNTLKLTPLHYAASHYAARAVRWLLANGADDTLMDAEGVTGKERVAALAETMVEDVESYNPTERSSDRGAST